VNRLFSDSRGLLFAFLSATTFPLAACSSDSGSEPSGDGDGDLVGDGDGDGDGDAGVPSGVACDRSERIGSFNLALANSYTTFRGAIASGVSPTGVPEVLGSEGSCELLGAPNLFCATPCASGTVCAGENQCVPEALKVSAGVVTISGLSATISEQPNGITLDYNRTLNDPYPAFDVGAVITLTAAGDEAEAFTLSGEGVGLLTSVDDIVDVVPGMPLVLNWETSGSSTHSMLDISLSVNAHGGTAAWIQCKAPDNGSFTIPADLLQALVDLGLSGFPRVTLTRRTIDSTSISTGCVDFAVASSVMLDVSVAGLVSCNMDDECPDGQTCNSFLYCE
jgi:hypothetical protein